MSWVLRQLNQTVVYWGNPANDGYGGRTFDDPVELDCRWSDKQDLFIDIDGQEKRSEAVVWVESDVVVGGYLYLGDLDDLSSAEEADPFEVTNAFEIRRFEKVPSVKADQFVRKAWLSRRA